MQSHVKDDGIKLEPSTCSNFLTHLYLLLTYMYHATGATNHNMSTTQDTLFTSRILSLSQTIASQTALIDNYLTSKDLPQPSFDANGPVDILPNAPSEVTDAKTAVLEASIELHQLLGGPAKLLLPEANFSPLACIQRFRIAHAVPLDAPISFLSLATKLNILEADLKRIIRFTASHHRIFTEPTPGCVAHTAASRLLATSPAIANVFALTFAECWPAHARAPDAIAARSEEPSLSGYTLANGTELSAFKFLERNPERGRVFAGAMGATSESSLEALGSGFAWAELGEGGEVVDVGGSRGHASIYLAKKFAGLRFMVQDLEKVVEGAEGDVPDEVAGRVRFEASDMFEEQEVKGAEVYLLRFVLHDWPDKYCVRVLKALVPALKRGAMVVVQDHILPEPGTLGLVQEMQIR